jgi:hypothetical protein
MLLLVPSDPLSPRRPDEHFAAEVTAAYELDVPIGYIDHDVLTDGDPVAAVRRVPAGADAVYRGWMVTSEQYAALEAALTARAATSGPLARSTGVGRPVRCSSCRCVTDATRHPAALIRARMVRASQAGRRPRTACIQQARARDRPGGAGSRSRSLPRGIAPLRGQHEPALLRHLWGRSGAVAVVHSDPVGFAPMVFHFGVDSSVRWRRRCSRAGSD